MPASAVPGHDVRVEILISLDATDPPAGRVRVPGRAEPEEIRFTGWLGLLRVLSEVMGSTAPEEKES
jgi:hypothetical protein